jgi:hypothetical protein
MLPDRRRLKLAKVGVVGSNPIARSRFSQENQEVESGPSGPFLLRGPGLQCNLSKINAIGRKSPDTLSCVWRYQSAALPTPAATPGEVAGRTYWSACRRSHAYAGPLCHSSSDGMVSQRSRSFADGRSVPETALEPLAILATNSASVYFRAGHADAIGQGREVQLRSAYRHGQGRTRDRREAWSAGRDRTGRRGVSTFEDDRIGTPGGDGCSRSADVGRWNGKRGREKSIGLHAKRSWQRCR